MSVVLTILFVASCLVLIASVLLQSGKTAGLSGSIGGGAEQIWGKNKARSYDDIFDKITKISAIVFMVTAVLLAYTQ